MRVARRTARHVHTQIMNKKKAVAKKTFCDGSFFYKFVAKAEILGYNNLGMIVVLYPKIKCYGGIGNDI